MKRSLAMVKTEKDKAPVNSCIVTIYVPWLESITQKSQALIENDASIFTSQSSLQETESYLLFVDAFRFELADEFSQRLIQAKYKTELQTSWSAIPSLTPTAKPNISPITNAISTVS